MNAYNLAVALSVMGHLESEEMAKSYIIEEVGGNCPVQAEGRIGGRTIFYFRARGDHWSMSIGGRDVVRSPKWYYAEDYGVWPEAGWMEESEARGFIDKAINMYWSGHKGTA